MTRPLRIEYPGAFYHVTSRGFTVRRYGVFINSIQIEIADTIRDFEQKRLLLIDDLAFAIINFVRRHAPF